MDGESLRPVRVALLGCGVVGSATARGLLGLSGELTARIGAPLSLVGIAVKSPDEVKDPAIPRELLTTNAGALTAGADIVIELIGGIEPARTLILEAFAHGASVVTANKALLAQHGPELFDAADAAGVDLYFEAAVGGAIPIIRPLRQSLAGDRVHRVLGIVNGTTNYVLDEMSRTGAPFAEVVRAAQQRGYAEADPTADIEGFDAASKAAILASIAFHSRVHLDDVGREGIAAITADDVAWAERTGHVIKLLAVVQRLGQDGRESIAAYVRPSLVPLDHQLASVKGAYNAIFIETELAGDLMFYGAGAGGVPTSSAVLGDVVAAAVGRVAGSRGPRESAYASLPLAASGEVVDSFQVRMAVADRTGVLAQVAGVFAAHEISIATMQQAGERGGGEAQLVFMTHPAPTARFDAAVAEIRGLPVVTEVLSVLRVEGV